MGCLMVLIAAASPRLGFFIFWVLRPERVDAAFDTFIFPLIGIIFFPMATLIYAALWTVGGLNGWEWFWVVVAGIFDLAHPSMVAANRRMVYPKGYDPQSLAP
jgi:uncharacterized membrane protein